ncbi:ACP S-malonyltransferase [Aquihabitans sp. McL0605]|uniref:ACP S-malonyltransferase n=1 Tax=Aquihabitans sp. McL0605 TaxID=3415671 RepID=UPI003CEDAEE9
MSTGPAAIAFPGQGGDWRATTAVLGAQAGHPLVRALADRLGTDRWDALDGLDTANAQPAIYVAGLVGPAATAPVDEISLAMGHSLGEITAAAWAGALSFDAGLDLMVARGALGRAAQDHRPGAMTAINRWERPKVAELAAAVAGRSPGRALEVAVVNSPTQIVLSGDEALVDQATDQANEQGAVARRLPIGGAYHSSLMASALVAFRAQVGDAVTAAPRVPVLSSTLQLPLRTVDELVDGLARSLVLAVDWPATIEAAAALGVDRAFEAGPGDTLRRLARFAPELAIVSL